MTRPVVPWPPAATDRNQLIFGAVTVFGALATIYFALFALQTAGLVPWVITVLLLAATLVGGVGLLLMREQRRSGG